MSTNENTPAHAPDGSLLEITLPSGAVTTVTVGVIEKTFRDLAMWKDRYERYKEDRITARLQTVQGDLNDCAAKLGDLGVHNAHLYSARDAVKLALEFIDIVHAARSLARGPE